MAIGKVVPTISPIDLNITLNVHYPEDLLSIDRFETALAASMKTLATEARDFWQSEAGRRLTTSRTQYQNAISVSEVRDSSFSLKLDGGFLPYAVEMGTESYEMNVKRGQVVPLNVNREVEMQNPVFRMGDGDPWTHPGFEAQNIIEAVSDHLTETLLPKHLQKVVEEL